MNRILTLFLLFAFFVSCINSTGESPSTENLPKITDTDNNIFIDEEGNPFIPWGFNYTNPQKIDLIEDKWDSESTWDTISEDFGEMKSYTANVVRIHLQYNKFMADEFTPDQQAFEKLEGLTKIAEKNDLYLLVTGLGAYRKSDAPEWYDNLSESARWETQALFWKNVANTIGNNNAVFAYDLMNEPVVSVGCDDNNCDWLPGEGLAGFHFVQNITLDPAKERVPTLKKWIDSMTSAIRSEDQETLITVGMLPLGPLDIFAEDVDFISTHIYPQSGDLQASVDYVKDNQTDKPFVIEEVYNLNCSIEELDSVLTAVEANTNGVVGHYFGQTIEELEKDSSTSATLHKNFIEFFMTNNPN